MSPDHTLRVIVKDGKVWFCLADACKALGINNPRKVKTRLDSEASFEMTYLQTAKIDMVSSLALQL